jgi:glycosyltransferase involved in cell wall biosynthesis
MPERRFRVLAVATHPVQYMAPLFRRLAAAPALDFQVAYCSMRGAQAALDPDFKVEVKWDLPLLDGYVWSEIPNRGSGEESFWGLNNPGLRELIRKEKFDAVLCYVGYVRVSFWIAQGAAKAAGSAFIFGTDAHNLAPRDGKNWKVWAKKLFWPWLFRQADQVIVPSSGTFDLMRQLGISSERITVTPYAVDNEWWKAESAKVDREAVRASWGAATGDAVILFCAKLQPWKRPMDLLRAFAEARIEKSILVFAGDGAERAGLQEEARKLGVSERVRFLGFVNQSQLPSIYTSADLLVLPSDYEPFAVVVNEAMCCGCPAIVSDQVGAARDLVIPLKPEFVFPAGDVGALAGTLQIAFADRDKLREIASAACALVEKHSPERTVAATIAAVRKAVEVKSHGR